MKKTAVIFALYWELRPFAKRLGVGFFESLLPVVMAKRGDILLARSGMGKGRAAKMAEKVINDFKPEYIISAGSCGALVEDLKIGDVIVSDFSDGKIFCSERILFTPTQKANARCRNNNAVVVDMESEAIYSAAKRYGVGFSAIKAVSDTARDGIFELFCFRRNATVAAEKLSEFLFDYLNPTLYRCGARKGD